MKSSQVCILVVLASISLNKGPALAGDGAPLWPLQSRIVAVGLPGVAGVQQVGRFHAGGPIPGNPDFLLTTGPGHVLDPERILVAVSSNFGSKAAGAPQAEGSILSIDPNGGAGGASLVVPEAFAIVGGQSETLGGAVRLYTADSVDFTNQHYNSGARTASFAAASGPRYMSVNNAFGRIWIGNAPRGNDGAGSVSVVDPDGRPLNNAPSRSAGGVFAGSSTNREETPKSERASWAGQFFNYTPSGQLTGGSLARGVVGTAFLGASPDGSGFAVFATVTMDGAVEQVHVHDGVDGLAPAGTVRMQPDDTIGAVIGMAFQWDPDRVLYLVDTARNRLVLLHLSDDKRQFKVSRTSFITTALLNQPVDLAPAVPEVSSPEFSSHTTLAGGSDLYVANRGDGTILRLRQDGTIVARANIVVPGVGALGGGQIRGIAVSSDAQNLFVTVEGESRAFPGRAGMLVEIAAFDALGPYVATATRVTEDSKAAIDGRIAFARQFTPATGLGPLFNARSCESCHAGPGTLSTSPDHFVQRVAHLDSLTGRVTNLAGVNSPVVRQKSTRSLGIADAPVPSPPRDANVFSMRMPLSLYASGRLDDIPDAAIEAQAVGKGDGIKGRVHWVTTSDGSQRVGRYGWKAHIATLDEMVGEALTTEIGVVSALAPRSSLGPAQVIEDDGKLTLALAAYVRSLDGKNEARR